MSRVFDYNGTIVAPSHPVKKLTTVRKMLVIDSGDRDKVKYPTNGDFVVYLPRVYENVVSIRLEAAEFPKTDKGPTNTTYVPTTGAPLVAPLYFLIDIEGLNKTDECSVGADRSGYLDGHFAKIANFGDGITPIYYNDNNGQVNIANYSPAIGKLDRMRLRTRLHTQKASGGFMYWPTEYSLTFEIEYLDNSFDSFSQFESRITDRA
jgi:hypothetical protein